MTAMSTLCYRNVTLKRRIGNFEKGTRFPLVVIYPFEGKLYLCEKDFSYADLGSGGDGSPPWPNHEFVLEVSIGKAVKKKKTNE